MKTMHKRLVATAAIAALLAVPLATSAQARDWRGSGGGGGGGYRGGYHHDNTGAYIGLGLGALALGSILAYSATQPSYAAPPAYYAPPPPPPGYYYPPQAYAAPPAAYYAPPGYDPYFNTYLSDPRFDRDSR